MEKMSTTVDTHIRAFSTIKMKETATYEWIINNYEFIYALGWCDFYTHTLDSPNFTVHNPNTTLKYLQLRTNGGKSKLAGLMSLYLELNSNGPYKSNKKIFKVSLMDKNEEKLFSKYLYQSRYINIIRIDEFCHIENLPKFENFHHSWKILCELMVLDDVIDHLVVDDSQSKNLNLTKMFKKDFENKKDGDITFTVGNQNLKAHKHVLINRCCVFARMFESNMVEAQQNKVIITDARPEIFEKMIDFLYTDEVEESLNKKDAEELLNVADKYQLDHLKQICQIFLFNASAEENRIPIIKFEK